MSTLAERTNGKRPKPARRRSTRKLLAEPSPSDWKRWEERLAGGEEPSQAAHDLGQTSSAFRRNDPDRHAAALELSRQARAEFVDRRVEEWALDPAAQPAVRMAWVKRWNPAYSDRSTVEMTGVSGGPVEVHAVVEQTPEQLARVLQRLGQLGLVQPGPAFAALAEGKPVLAALTE